MRISISKLPVQLCLLLLTVTSLHAKDCSFYKSLIPNFKCVNSPKNSISGFKYPTYIITQKDSNRELLLLIIPDPDKAMTYKSNLEKNAEKSLTPKLLFTKSNDKGTSFVFNFPKNQNIFTKLTDPSQFALPRDILILSKKILELISANKEVICMYDITPQNIVLDMENNPKFLLLKGPSDKKSSSKELAFALGIIIYTMSQRKEPFSRNLKYLSAEIKNTPLEIKKDTSLDIINMIIKCLGAKNSKNIFDSLQEAFIETLNKPKIDLLSKDQVLIPSSNTLSDAPEKIEAISITFVIVYIIAFLIGSITFCTLKKPIQAQQRNQVNPMMNGLENAERNLQVMQGNRNVDPPRMPA